MCLNGVIYRVVSYKVELYAITYSLTKLDQLAVCSHVNVIRE